MGTPIRPADLILGIHRMDPAEFASSERLLIIERVLDWCRPSLKYMPGFTEIRFEMNKSLGHNDLRVTDMNIVQFPAIMSGNSRCTYLAEVSSHEIKLESSGGNRSGKVFELVNLWLRQEGGVVRWNHRYTIEVTSGLGYRAHHSGHRYVVVASKLEHIFGPELEKSLEPVVFLNVLNSLQKIVAKCVEDRQRHLSAMQNLLYSIETLGRHIEHY